VSASERSRGLGSHPSRRHGWPFRPEHHLRAGHHQAPQADRQSAVRRPSDDFAAEPLRGPVHRRRLRLDHFPRRGRGADRTDSAADTQGRSACRSGYQARDAAVGSRPLPRSARHSHGHDRGAGFRRPEVHGGRGDQDRPCARRLPRSTAREAIAARGPRRRRGQPRYSRAVRPSWGGYPRRRLDSVEEGPRYLERDPVDQGSRRRGYARRAAGRAPIGKAPTGTGTGGEAE